MKTPQAKFLIVFVVMITVLTLSGCNKKDSIVIYSSCDQVRNAAFMKMLSERFPNYTIDLLYMSGGAHGARLIAEGKNTHADITLGLEVSYLRQIRDILADHSDFDVSNFMPDLLDPYNMYIPWERFGCVIAINEKLLNDKGLPIPTNYEDLLNPIYRGLISMPSPRSSIGGHLFLAYFIKRMGEDAAFAYFDKLAKNVNQFSVTGSGVTTALLNGDIAIGFTLLHNAVNEIDRGADLSLTFFDGHSPSSLGGAALTRKGAKNNVAVTVFEYLITEVSIMDKQLYSPGQVFLDETGTRKHYPADIKYKLFILDQEARDRILDRWRF